MHSVVKEWSVFITKAFTYDNLWRKNSIFTPNDNFVHKGPFSLKIVFIL